MKKIGVYSTVFFFCFLLNSSYRGEKSDFFRKIIKTSIIVPCHPAHAPYLYNLLKCYEKQTVLPTEVVISLSEADRVDNDLIKRLQEKKWAFPVKLILNEQKLYAGENRNKACESAIGDVFICQDADDIPHPQRVEVIRYLFQKYDIDHLMHQFIKITSFQATVKSFNDYNDLDSMPFFYRKDLKVKVPDLTNGNVAISRNVFKQIQWSHRPRAQDVVFCKSVYQQFSNCIVLPRVLIGYRQFLSTQNL